MVYIRDVVFPSNTEDYDLFFQAIVEQIRSKAGDEVASQTIDHIRSEYSTLDWIFEGMIIRSGLNIVRKESNGFLATYICTKTQAEQAGADNRRSADA